MGRMGLYRVESRWEIALHGNDHELPWDRKHRPRTPGKAFKYFSAFFFFGILFLLMNSERIKTLQNPREGVLAS